MVSTNLPHLQLPLCLCLCRRKPFLRAQKPKPSVQHWYSRYAATQTTNAIQGGPDEEADTVSALKETID